MNKKCALNISIKSSPENTTCYPDEAIHEFVKKVLKKIPASKIMDNINAIDIYIKEKYGLDEINDIKWADYDEYFARIEKKYYLPRARWAESDGLVSNFDVRNIMYQLEGFYNSPSSDTRNNIREHKIFRYLGDYDADLYKDKSRLIKMLKFGRSWRYNFILFALWGEKIKLYKHWVCVIIDHEEKVIIFYDSCIKNDTLLTISDVIDTINNSFGDKQEKKYKFVYAKYKNQWDYENCGILCVHVLTSVLQKKGNTIKTFEEYNKRMCDLKEKIGNDAYYEYVRDLRKKYFIL